MKVVYVRTKLTPRRMSVLIALTALVVGATPLAAQTFTDFESFSLGTIDGQSGWRATGAFLDEEIVDISGNQVWRLSNAGASGSFGDQPFAPGTDLYGGETGALHDYDSAVANTNRFSASFDFWSVTGAAQAGLQITVSPDDGSGRRQSFIRLVDTGTGIDIVFFDTQDNHPVNNPNGGFIPTTVATGLSYTDVHNVAINIEFVGGNNVDGGSGNITGNDIVTILVNGAIVHTGTTWESYWQTTTEGQTPPAIRAVDTLLFRVSTGAAGTIGNGFYLDNLLLTNAPVQASVPAASAWVAAALGLVLFMLTGLATLQRRNRHALRQA